MTDEYIKEWFEKGWLHRVAGNSIGSLRNLAPYSPHNEMVLERQSLIAGYRQAEQDEAAAGKEKGNG